MYLTIVVAVGRVQRTRVLLAAGISGLVVDAVLLVILVPPLGMIGASIALVGCFAAALPVLYWFVQKVFPLPFEWRRLGAIALTTAVTYGIGVAATPESGASAFLIRGALVPVSLLMLWPLGFLTQDERSLLRRLVARPSRVES
jgi:O-antigen/teichoic acid export membrane protein